MLLPFKGCLPRIASSAFIEESARVIGDVTVEGRSSVWFNAVLRGDIGFIRIGHRTNIQDGTVVHVSTRHPVVIGDDVTVGHNAVLHGCKVGNRSLIGMGAVVLDGAEIGEEAIVAAGSVVAPGTLVPPRTLAAGAPARPKRELSPADIEGIVRSAGNYVGYMAEYRAPDREGGPSQGR